MIPRNRLLAVLFRARSLALVCSTAATLSAQQTAPPASVQSSAGVSASATAPPRPPKPNEVVTGTGPNGAKMRCRDGSYPAASAPDNACDAKGGVLVRFPLRRLPERAPAMPRAAAPTIAQPPQEPAPEAALRAAAPIGSARAAQTVPANATLLCVDGTFIVSDTASVRCAGKGGVSVIFPVKRRP